MGVSTSHTIVDYDARRDGGSIINLNTSAVSKGECMGLLNLWTRHDAMCALTGFTSDALWQLSNDEYEKLWARCVRETFPASLIASRGNADQTEANSA